MMAIAGTKTDPVAQTWAINDEPVRIREWGTDRMHPLPSEGEAIVGTGTGCDIRLVDPTDRMSRRHAVIAREQSGLFIRDMGSKNGVRIDGERREQSEVAPGAELGLGGLVLIVESTRSIALRSFLARVIGWSAERAQDVDRALRAVRMAATGRASLVLCGGLDSLSIAHSIHRLALGNDRPFVTCDPRRRTSDESARTFQNFTSALDAVEHARGGSVCAWSVRLPHDFDEAQAASWSADTRAQLVICTGRPTKRSRLLGTPIAIPSLVSRRDEIEHVIREYAQDAVAELNVASEANRTADRAWVREHAASSLREIETVTLRLAALRGTDNLNQAAAKLDLAHVSLRRWVERWGLL
jgi:hypothetical protein